MRDALGCVVVNPNAFEPYTAYEVQKRKILEKLAEYEEQDEQSETPCLDVSAEKTNAARNDQQKKTRSRAKKTQVRF